jgi:hypothetical protein
LKSGYWTIEVEIEYVIQTTSYYTNEGKSNRGLTVKSQSFLPLLRMIVAVSSRANRKISTTAEISGQNGMKRVPPSYSKQANEIQKGCAIISTIHSSQISASPTRITTSLIPSIQHNEPDYSNSDSIGKLVA